MANHPEKGHNRTWKKRLRTIVEECKMLKTSMAVEPSSPSVVLLDGSIECFASPRFIALKRRPSGLRHEYRMKASNADNSEAAAHSAFVASWLHKSWSASGNPDQ